MKRVWIVIIVWGLSLNIQAVELPMTAAVPGGVVVLDLGSADKPATLRTLWRATGTDRQR